MPQSIVSTTNSLRILSLCGFRTNAAILAKQLEPIRHKLVSSRVPIDFVCVDPVHKASGPPYEEVSKFFNKEMLIGGGVGEWWYVEDPESDYANLTEYKGLEESLNYIEDILLYKGPFHGILGFSQGGTLATAIIASTERGYGKNKPHFEQLKFGISIANFIPRDALARQYMGFSDDYIFKNTPICFIMGDKDREVTPHSIKMSKFFEKKVIIRHDKGHIVPSLEKQEDFETLRNFIILYSTT